MIIQLNKLDYFEVKKVYIGTSGYNYKDWKGKFYPKDQPEKNWLNFYSKHFNTVEINATFYRSFPKSVFENWAKKTPENFKFVIKGSRYITHIKRIKNVEDELNNFFAVANGLGKKLAVVLWQFPASFRCKKENIERLDAFVKILPKVAGHAFEFRHASWFNKDVYEIIEKSRLSLVINDSTVFPATNDEVGNFIYIRFHGPSLLYSSSYSDTNLEKWVGRIKKILGKKDVYCYFNNDVAGYAVDNALKLREYLDR